jgi:hypothetical protein
MAKGGDGLRIPSEALEAVSGEFIYSVVFMTISSPP